MSNLRREFKGNRGREMTVEGVYTAEQLLNRKVKKLPTLLEPLLPKVGLCSLAGSSDTGKSSFLRQLAIDVSLGKDEFLGFPLNLKHKKAIYVSTEDSDDAYAFALAKANRKRNLQNAEYKDLRVIVNSEYLLDTLDELVKEAPVDLIVIDAFADLYGNSMNETNKVRTFLNEFSQFATKNKCLIIFLHHTGKNTDKEAPSKHNLLGSQGFEAKMRLVMILRNDFHNKNKKHLCLVKGNYLPSEFKQESLVLTFDESLEFTMTNERTPFEELRTGDKTSKKEEVLRLSKNGMTQAQISEVTGISQPTISRYLKQ